MINNFIIRRSEIRKYCLLIILHSLSLLVCGQTEIDSLNVLLKEQDEKQQAEILNKLSLLYENSNPEKAILFAERALNNSIKYNNTNEKGKALLNLGKLYLNIEKPEESYQKIKQSLGVFEQINNFQGISESITALGDLYYTKMDVDSAMYYYKKAIDIKTDLEDFQKVCALYYKLGLIYINQSELEKAKQSFDKIISYSKLDPELKRDSFRKLSEVYEKESNIIGALYYFKLYAQINDSIQKTVLKNKEINKEQILDPVSSDRKILIGILYSGLGVILVFTGLLSYFYYEKRKANKILLEQNRKILKQNTEIKSQSENLSKFNTELEKLSIVASKTDNAIIIASPEGIIEWINESYTRLYGFTLNELLKEKGSSYCETSFNPEAKEIFEKAIETKEAQIYESDVIARNGRNFRIQTTLTPVLNEHGEVIYLIAIDSDVTKLKNTEKELQKLLITKDRFFSIIAHDLKNPFNNIMGISQLLVQGFERMKPEKVKYFHKGLYEISKNGYELLINLLEWARSQKGSMEFNPTVLDFYKLGVETFSLYQTRANQKEIVLTNHVKENTEIFADINMIKTILRNLVSNALKFTDRGGAIEICSETKQSHIQITVRDTGIGIEPKAANSLFKIDEYISTEGTENETGTGLGLILCKEFVEKHGGSIWVESKVGFGSKFNFTLPLNKEGTV